MARKVPLGRRPPKERGLSPLRRREEITGYLFASPIIVGLIALAAYPFLASVYYSFNDYNVIQQPYWTGLRNYHDLLSDPLFWRSLANTAIYSAVSIPLGLVLGLGLAILLKQKLRSIGFFRALAYLPSVVPTVAGTILWLWILNPQYGVINNLLGVFGIIGALQVFNQPYIFGNGGGGPENSILFYVVYLYQTAFQNFQMGYASAMALILFVVILALTLLVMWSGKHWVYYEGTAPK